MGGSEISEKDKADDKAPDKEGKIQRSLKSMMMQMQLSDDEIKYRMENFDNVDVVKEYLKYLKCTKCNANFQQVIKRGDLVGIHPLLGVLMCDSCCDYYGDGNFSLDSEGEDKYCRWCGEGGTIFACTKCICGFCDVCIKKHFGEKGLEAVEKDDDWICYFCNPQPLWYLRSICSLAKEAARNKRNNLRKVKGTSVRKKRRKTGNLEDDWTSSNDSITSSSNSSNNSENTIKRKSKRKSVLRQPEKIRGDGSSSSEDEKENHINTKRRAVKSKKQSVDVDENKESSESDTKKSKKKWETCSEEKEFESKKRLVLQKLKSIWRLTQTITEVGVSSSRDKLKSLSKFRCITLECLRKEHEDLKSCMNVLVSSLNTASNSVNSIKEDLTFDATKEETESFRSQEIKLKTLAEKFHEELNDHTSAGSEGDSFRKELKEKEGRKKQPVKGPRKSVRESIMKKKRESERNSEEEKGENSGGVNKSKSLFSDSGSDEESKKQNSVKKGEEVNEDEKVGELDKTSDRVKPLLKVKSFARMLDDNVYDKCNNKEEKTTVVIDLCDMDTDEGENESKNRGSADGEDKNVAKLSSKVDKNSEEELNKENNFVNGKHRSKTRSNEKNNQRISSNKGVELEESTEDEAKKKNSNDSEGGTKRRERKSKTKEKTNSGFEDESFANENDKSSDQNSDKKGTKKTEFGRKKKKCLADDENQDNSSENEETKSSDDERGRDSEKEPGENKPSDSKKQESKETNGNDDGSEKEDNEKDEDSGKKESSEDEEEEDNRKNDSDATTTTVDDDDITEKADENEKNKRKPGNSNNESTKEKDIKTTSDDESKDKNSSSAEDEGKEKSQSKGKKSDSSDIDSKSSSSAEDEGKEKSQSKGKKSDSSDIDSKSSSSAEDERKEKSQSKGKKSDSSDIDSKSSSSEEKNTIMTRKKKKEVKVSFELFKRKRERFLKSSKENSESKTDKGKVNVTKALESSESENEKKETEKKRGRLKKKRILASSDEEGGETGEKAKEMTSSEESEKDNKNKESEHEEVKPSTRSESSSEEVETKKRRRIKKRQKGSSDSSEEENKRKKKRRDSSSESSEDEKTKKKKKGRKNIKKILKKDSLHVETKEALKNEEERKKRLKERQRLFQEFFPQEDDQEVPKQLVLDFNPETKEPLVTVHKKLVKKLKPHQVKGVKFMWDSCFESVQKLEEESGSGCILAHCMGLGKTLQVITLVHTAMTHDLGVNTVLIVCPLSTVSNWLREFETWLANVHTEPITLFDLVKYKKQDERLFHLKDWHENGGVLVLSYDLFRNLTKIPAGKKDKKRKPKYQQIFEKTLLDPGPDLVVCDEGHLLKNEDTALSRCMSRVKTSRRIVLTGTPLQNNLIEYHCMVQFVKPNILGTKKEFCNRFVNPINNGQFEDSTELDVKIMKRRSHVLHSMLDGCIQRFDYSVLTPFLPEKQEYVLSISLTDTQAKAYMHFINNLSARASGSSRAASLFNDYHTLQKIWTHPRTMLMQSEKEAQKEELDRDSEGSLKDFVVSSSEETEKSGSESSDDSVQEVTPRKRLLRSNANDPDMQKAIEEEEKLQSKHWWDEFYDEKAYDDLRESNKLVILFSLLKYCGQKKDKLLVFSQSLYSLDLIEYFLARIDENNKKDEATLCGHRDTWIHGSDYFRLDGSTSSETRAVWCKYFNKESNTRARLFLISTRAGGLGINLYGANRVVIFDASWNPSHDLQSIFRVYRFGQKKPCYIYRFLSEATMEEKIYERQVTKLSLAHRVVDEHQIERHYSMGNLQELYSFQPTPKDKRKVPNLPKDPVFADILAEHKEIIVGYHEHDSLLENKQEEELTEEERKAAWKEYEEEKMQKTFNFNPGMMQQAQFVQGNVGMQQVLNPAAMINTGQNFINPIFVPTNIPLETISRGLRVGVTPLPNESFDSYIIRILNREAWMQGRQAQKQ